MMFLKDCFEKDNLGGKSADDKTHEKLPSMQIVKSKPQINYGRLNTCNFVCGTSHVLNRPCIGQLFDF